MPEQKTLPDFASRFSLLPDDLEEEDVSEDTNEDLEEVPADEAKTKVDEDSKTKDGSDKPERDPFKEIETLRAELSALKTLSSEQLVDLRRSVGRAQSIADKLDKAPQANPKAEATLRKEIGSIHDILGALADSTDTMALDPSVRSKILAAREASRRQADTDSL